LGTSTLKAVIYDSEFKTVAKKALENETTYPRPNWAEQDQRQWWTNAVRAIRTVLNESKINPAEVLGVGTCGQCHGLNLVDEKCNPLYDCLIWPDLRSIEQAERIRKETGNSVGAYYTAAKLLWMVENKPELVQKSYKILLPKDYLRAKLSGSFCTDISDAWLTELYDASKGEWNRCLLDFIGVPIEKLPEIYPSESIVGTITKEAAQETGLREGIPVIAGKRDDSIEAVALAVKPSNEILLCLGTAPAILAAPSDPRKVKTDGGFIGGYMGSGGGSLKWFVEQFGRVEEKMAEELHSSPYRVFDEEAEKIEAGSGGLLFLPHMMGERSPYNPSAKGVLYGLSLGHQREHVYRAIIEGITFHLRAIWDSAKALDPEIDVKKILAFGGGSKSTLWKKIIASVFNLPVYSISEEETATLDLALHISVGVRRHESVLEAASSLNVSLLKEVTPSQDLHEKYEKSYKLYREIEEKLFQHKDYFPKPFAT
jgi:xylulokinase